MREAYVNFHSFINKLLVVAMLAQAWTVSLSEGFNHVKILVS